MLDVEELLLRVRNALHQPGAGAVAFVNGAITVDPSPPADDSESKTADILAELRQLDRQLETCADSFGNLPLSPPTLRGRAGRMLVRVVQRLLFWYTPPLRQLHEIMLKRCEEETRVLDKLLQIVRAEAPGHTTPFYGPVLQAGTSVKTIAILRALPSACLASLSLSDISGPLDEILDQIARVLRPGGFVTFNVHAGRAEELRLALAAKGLLPDRDHSNVITGRKPK